IEVRARGAVAEGCAAEATEVAGLLAQDLEERVAAGARLAGFATHCAARVQELCEQPGRVDQPGLLLLGEAALRELERVLLHHLVEPVQIRPHLDVAPREAVAHAQLALEPRAAPADA